MRPPLASPSRAWMIDQERTGRMFGIRVFPTGTGRPARRAPVHGPAIRCRTTPAALKLPFFSPPSLPGSMAIDAAGNDTVGAAGTQLGRRRSRARDRRGASDARTCVRCVGAARGRPRRDPRVVAACTHARGIHGFFSSPTGFGQAGSIDVRTHAPI